MTLRGTPVYTTAPLAFTTAPVSSPFVLPFATAAPPATTATSSTTASATGMGGVFGSGNTAVLLTAPATTTPPSSAMRAQTMEAYMTAAPANILSSPHPATAAATTTTTTTALPYTAAFSPAAYAAYTHGVANGLLYTATPSLTPAGAMGNNAFTLAHTAAAAAPTTSVACNSAPQQYFATTPTPATTTTAQSCGDTTSSKHASHDSSSDGSVAAAAAAADARTTTPPQQQQQQQQSVTNLGTKLFVGQVPAVCTEEQLRPLFAEFGALIEVKIMREHNGRSKGSAWVRYESEDAARRAIAALHEKFVVPPQTNALRVQFASMSAPRRPRMPFVAMHNNAPAAAPPAAAPASAASAGSSVRPLVQQQHAQLSSSPVAGGYTMVQHSSASDKGYYGGDSNNAAVLKTAAAAGGGGGGGNIEQSIDSNGNGITAARADGGGYSLATSAAMTSPYAPSMLAAHEQARLAQLHGASLVNGVLYTTLPATALAPAAAPTANMATTTMPPTSVYGQLNLPSQPLQTAAPQTSMTAANNSSTALLNTLLLGGVGVPWQHGV